jgi:hypothetical protein
LKLLRSSVSSFEQLAGRGNTIEYQSHSRIGFFDVGGLDKERCCRVGAALRCGNSRFIDHLVLPVEKTSKGMAEIQLA